MAALGLAVITAPSADHLANLGPIAMKKLLILSVLTLFLTAACHHGMRAEVKGSGNRQTQKREVAQFTSITTDGASRGAIWIGTTGRTGKPS